MAGEIDHYTAGPLIEALDPGAFGGRPRVVVDMRRVSFMDSSGINVFLFAHRDLGKAGGWLRLAGLCTRSSVAARGWPDRRGRPGRRWRR
ncbi:STAS domain-containing protein [Streptomyces sp. 1222.5]|uniref:STAS domain-containing protein n=1 Tax=Streptomyces sp. 1222.5 TaxID=1881026 RepID=UPI003D71D062